MVEWLLCLCLWTLFLGDAEGLAPRVEVLSTVSLKLDSDGLEVACSGCPSCPLKTSAGVGSGVNLG